MSNELRLSLRPDTHRCSFCGSNWHVRFEDRGTPLCDDCARELHGNSLYVAVLAASAHDKRKYRREPSTPEHFYCYERWKERD